jgi:hypothetical protein
VKKAIFLLTHVKTTINGHTFYLADHQSTMSSGLELRPILGIGGKEASMKGMDGSSYIGHFLIRAKEII